MNKTFVPQDFAQGERPQIPLVPVESKQVAAIGYDPFACILAVRFKHGAGAIYHYPGVSAETFNEFVTAESIGRFFAERIKPLAFDKYPPEPVVAQS